MLQLFWICFIVGVALAGIVVIFGEVLDGLLEGMFEILSFEGMTFFHPVTLVGGLTAFGGSGILLMNRGDQLGAATIVFLAFLIAVTLSLISYFIYVKPMRKAEQSISFSNQELVGMIGEVTVSVPANGYGEVMIRVGVGHVTEIACSFDQTPIPVGAKAIVVEYKDGAAYLSEWGKDELPQ